MLTKQTFIFQSIRWVFAKVFFTHYIHIRNSLNRKSNKSFFGMLQVLKTFLLLALLILMSTSSFSQSGKVDHITFGRRMDKPIKIEVMESGSSYSFYARNRSFYTYIVTLKIDNIYNLNPAYVNKTYKVLPGRHALITLNVNDKEFSSGYRYSYSFSLGVPCSDINESYPYLLPFMAPFTYEFVDEAGTTIYKNSFLLSKGDTVYAMRKGRVVATPGMYHEGDRISKKESFEVLHKDGTILVYENLDSDVVFAKPEKTVYPGQPIGIVDDTGKLHIELYAVLGKGRLKPLNINFCINANETVGFSKLRNSMISSYPEEVVKREMSKSEIKKLQKGKLFSDK
ncbi:MAG TPA: hypothetical protein DDX98_00450 [Bacteroidales bacterium]|jgi:hypothetical protein|nr:hypothetical protein [Bacteroidales bacterium]